MKYLVKVDELKEKNDYLETKLETIHENINLINTIKENVIWEGEAKTKFFEKYNKYYEELNRMEEEIIEMIAFLKSYYSNYDEEYNTLKSKYQRILNEVER